MRRPTGRALLAGFLLVCLTVLAPGCFPGDDGSPYYGRIVVPRHQEFRWSDGGLPRVFDPALAAAPPDTDAVRALFEGLTDYDPQTLKPVPGVATRWESSEDGRVWTFYLREEARWSTGEQVTAGDFVRSWERTLMMGDLAPHTDLLSNIVGARTYVGAPKVTTPSQASLSASTSRTTESQKVDPAHPQATPQFGAEEVSAQVLRVHLQRANPNFPALVAHPVFRPVKVDAQGPKTKLPAAQLISNGAFHLAQSDAGRVSLQRAENYWDKGQVNLERVEFVETRDAETALAAYYAGDIDAVTNAPFEPLALKLLAPYADYRRETYGALTYYSFNTSRAPFNDVRVREALAISINRERISDEEMAGATDPANRFIPLMTSPGRDDAVVAKSATVNTDQVRARQLLAAAGYPDGVGFPVIHLLVNRNDQQRQVAQAVATMWRTTLKIETEIQVRNWDEYEAAIRAGDYDLARRGSVMQTADEFSNISMFFPAEEKATASPVAATRGAGESTRPGNQEKGTASSSAAPREKNFTTPIETEAEAIRELKAIPIYFASSYALVKPYVVGFDSNILDAPSLKSVRINTGWQAPKTNSGGSAR
jgi:oligopeptide transport system substrate-binding protein